MIWCVQFSWDCGFAYVGLQQLGKKRFYYSRSSDALMAWLQRKVSKYIDLNTPQGVLTELLASV